MKLQYGQALQERAERLLQWERGETPGPWELVVFPTNRCNLRCSICWQRWVEQERGEVDYKSELPDQRLLELVDEAAELGVRYWHIVGGGEPLVREALVMAMCEKICAHGMNGTLQTNATRFSRGNIQQLISMGWGRVTVSLDGPTAEINDAIRSAGSFERATENLRIFSELKRTEGVAHPYIILSMVVTNLNCDKIADMLRLTHELGCDELTPIRLVVQGDLCAGFALSDKQRAELPEQVRRAEALAQELGLPASFHDLVFDEQPAQEGYARAECLGIAGDGRFSDAFCFEPWTTLAIIAEDGRIGPCSPSWELNADTARNTSLKELWLDSYMQDIRRRIRSRKNLPEYCKNCCSDIPGRTRTLRTLMETANRPSLSDMGPLGATRFMAGRFAENLKHRGLRQTLRRTKEWFQIRIGKR